MARLIYYIKNDKNTLFISVHGGCMGEPLIAQVETKDGQWERYGEDADARIVWTKIVKILDIT